MNSSEPTKDEALKEISSILHDLDIKMLITNQCYWLVLFSIAHGLIRGILALVGYPVPDIKQINIDN